MNTDLNFVAVTILPDGRMDSYNASLYTGYSQKTLAMMRCNGTGPPYVKRGRIFYYKSDLDEWMLSARTQSTPQARLLEEATS